MKTEKITHEHLGLQEIRCKKCKKVIAYGYLISGDIRIQCRDCKIYNQLWALPPNNVPAYGLPGEKRHEEQR